MSIFILRAITVYFFARYSSLVALCKFLNRKIALGVVLGTDVIAFSFGRSGFWFPLLYYTVYTKFMGSILHQNEFKKLNNSSSLVILRTMLVQARDVEAGFW